MTQVYSKCIPPTGVISATCVQYVHPWTESCLQAIVGLYLYSIMDSARLYTTVYVLTLLTKGRIPTKNDLKKTFYGIVQSTAFLSGTAFGYSFFLCLLRRILGNFNILTVSALPAFLASVFAILIERPSRRTLLSLYVSNVATETVWNMAEDRGWVKSVNHGQVAIFGASMALLLWFYKGGFHTAPKDRQDSMFGVLRFILGPYEEKDYTVRSSQASSFYRQQVSDVPNNPSTSRMTESRRSSSRSHKNTVFQIVNQALRAYKKIIQRIKCFGRHNECPHPFSCIYYAIQGTTQMFSLGLGIQFTLKLIFNIKRICASPRSLKAILFRTDTLNLATFLGGFAGLFRATLCLLRRTRGKDSPTHALAAGLVAGIAFIKYPDTTIALYVLWKAAQISYKYGIDRGYVPKVPGFTEFLYCFSTAVLFHAALLEPSNLRPSYWKFLHSNSGGRVACMNREPLDAWGLNTSESLERVLRQTKTIRKVYF